MLNPTGTVCFVNATLQGLAWMTLWCNALRVDQWDRGFELMTLVTQWTAIPVNILVSSELHAVLFSPWGPESLQRQQDMLDFVYHLLLNMRPHFLGCEWKPQLSVLNLLEGTYHSDEKGHMVQPILLRLTHPDLASCTLQSLVLAWHDSQGLCRALTKACPALCLAIDRAVDIDGPPYTRKSLQQIDLADGALSMPVFSPDATINFITFRIVAVTFHIGLQPSTGHYRSALFNGVQWYAYDDGRLPDVYPTLPSDVLQQINFVWLVAADRTDDPAGASSTERSGTRPADPSGASSAARPGPYER
eukprot:s4171_g3.t1